MALGKGKAAKSSSGASMSAYDVEVEARLKALEAKVRQSRLMMKRPGHDEYERLVDVVCDHEERLSKEEEELQKCTESVSELEDADW